MHLNEEVVSYFWSWLVSLCSSKSLYKKREKHVQAADIFLCILIFHQTKQSILKPYILFIAMIGSALPSFWSIILDYLFCVWDSTWGLKPGGPAFCVSKHWNLGMEALTRVPLKLQLEGHSGCMSCVQPLHSTLAYTKVMDATGRSPSHCVIVSIEAFRWQTGSKKSILLKILFQMTHLIKNRHI